MHFTNIIIQGFINSPLDYSSNLVNRLSNSHIFTTQFLQHNIPNVSFQVRKGITCKEIEREIPSMRKLDVMTL